MAAQDFQVPKTQDPVPTYAELLARTDAPPGSSWSLFGAGDRAARSARPMGSAISAIPCTASTTACPMRRSPRARPSSASTAIANGRSQPLNLTGGVGSPANAIAIK